MRDHRWRTTARRACQKAARDVVVEATSRRKTPSSSPSSRTLKREDLNPVEISRRLFEHRMTKEHGLT